MSRIEIRKIDKESSEADCQRAVELDRAIFTGEDPLPPDCFFEPGTTTFVAEVNGQPAGIMVLADNVGVGRTFNDSSLPDLPDYLNIWSFGVLEEFRALEVEFAMYYFMIHYAREKGMTHLIMNCRKSNDVVVDFARRLGFKQTGVRRGYYRKPEKEDSLVFELAL